MAKPLLYLPPYFGAQTDGNLIKVYSPGRELRTVLPSWEDYLNYVRDQTLAKEAAHETLVTRAREREESFRALGFKLELKL